MSEEFTPNAEDTEKAEEETNKMSKGKAALWVVIVLAVLCAVLTLGVAIIDSTTAAGSMIDVIGQSVV